MGLRILPRNYFDEAVIAVTPAAVATLPETNLQSNVRERVWRSPNLDPQVISGNWSGNVRQISSWGVWPGTLTGCLIGAQVRVQLFQDLAMTISVYDSTALDVFAFSGVGWGNFNWGATPWGCDALDRTARLTPLVKYFAAVAASAFKITITNAGAVDTPYFEARRFWLADYVEATYGAQYNNASFGAATAWKSSSMSERSIGGSLRRVRRARWRDMRFEISFATESERSVWSDLLYASDPANEIVLSLFPAEATKRERDFTVMGSLEMLNPVVWGGPVTHSVQFAIVES